LPAASRESPVFAAASCTSGDTASVCEVLARRRPA